MQPPARRPHIAAVVAEEDNDRLDASSQGLDACTSPGRKLGPAGKLEAWASPHAHASKLKALADEYTHRYHISCCAPRASSSAPRICPFEKRSRGRRKRERLVRECSSTVCLCLSGGLGQLGSDLIHPFVGRKRVVGSRPIRYRWMGSTHSHHGPQHHPRRGWNLPHASSARLLLLLAALSDVIVRASRPLQARMGAKLKFFWQSQVPSGHTGRSATEQRGMLRKRRSRSTCGESFVQ